MQEEVLPAASSRRTLLLGGGAALGALTIASCRKAVTSGVHNAEEKDRTSLHQEESFDVSPARVYQALLSTAEFAAFSGQKATIEPAVGGAFSLFDGQVVGINLDLVPSQRIVQAWRAIGDWPAGIFSIVHFALAPKGNGTQLALDHTGFRPGDFDHLNRGWAPHYWVPMRKYFASHG